MTKISENKMKKISGGSINWNGTLLNSLIKYVKLFYEIGQALGSAFRRIDNNSICSA